MLGSGHCWTPSKLTSIWAKFRYKDVERQEVSVRFIGTTTAILLNKIRLVAVVGGNEVTNPFVVTEVYVQQSDTWMLASLSFTRLLTP